MHKTADSSAESEVPLSVSRECFDPFWGGLMGKSTRPEDLRGIWRLRMREELFQRLIEQHIEAEYLYPQVHIFCVTCELIRKNQALSEEMKGLKEALFRTSGPSAESKHP